jgi:hypothetical protein
MDDLIIPEHALEQMQRDSPTEDDVYTVVGDYDEIVERPDGRTVYSRLLDDGRHVTAVIEDDGVTVVTAWVDARRSRRRRR